MENAARLRNGRAPKRPTIENDHPTSSLDNDKSRHPDSTIHIRDTRVRTYTYPHTYIRIYTAYVHEAHTCTKPARINRFEGSSYVRIFDKPFGDVRKVEIGE